MDLPLHEYSAEPALRRPGLFVRQSAAAARSSLGIAWRLFQRDMRASYRQSVLGYLWLVIPAAASALAWILLANNDIIDPGAVRAPYPVYVFTGTILWQGFVEAMNSPLRKLAAASQMMTKVNFPTEALLLSGFGEVLVNAVARCVVLVPVFLLYDVRPSWTLPLAVVGILAILLFGWGIGLLTAPIGLLYEDVGRTLLVITMFWFLFSPVAYLTPSSGRIGEIQRFNPMTHLLTTGRQWIIGDAAGVGIGWVVVTAASVLLVVVGWLLYRLAVPHLIDRMQA